MCICTRRGYVLFNGTFNKYFSQQCAPEEKQRALTIYNEDFCQCPLHEGFKYCRGNAMGRSQYLNGS